ncbi:hypothetical protein FMG_P0128 (plasmid) [Finegoldia magna ATCC 29328]|uniref:Uncharacterized protein n=1 Tax=Finegoldia magna (strain ATCC 29328 / DSM 20472 / WAL 2508) TaxID=334413 RepID=B0S4I5_FINM2|nr:hypothetical protein FMG_P0128 [Finegoldia magna ATCC 29328]
MLKNPLLFSTAVFSMFLIISEYLTFGAIVIGFAIPSRINLKLNNVSPFHTYARTLPYLSVFWISYSNSTSRFSKYLFVYSEAIFPSTVFFSLFGLTDSGVSTPISLTVCSFPSIIHLNVSPSTTRNTFTLTRLTAFSLISLSLCSLISAFCSSFIGFSLSANTLIGNTLPAIKQQANNFNILSFLLFFFINSIDMGKLIPNLLSLLFRYCYTHDFA